MSSVNVDAYGHLQPSSNGSAAALAAAASGSAAGTVVPGGTVVTATPTSVVADDTAGNFLVVSATTGAGIAATVYFANAYSSAPKSVITQAFDQTGTVTVSSAAQPVSAGLQAGFSVYISAAAATGRTIQISYSVVP